ncbi:MAG: pilus assembly PilX family protein [bacterium]
MSNRLSVSTVNPARQSGAALLTTMVFLVVLTIIGVSTMQNNRIEQKMTTNQQEINHSFQYAETGLVPGIKSAELLNTADIGAPDYDTPDMYLCHASGDVTSEEDCVDGSNIGNAAVVTKYRGVGKKPPPNYSLESGFASHFFYVSSRGRSNKSESTHDLGVSLVGPSGLE